MRYLTLILLVLLTSCGVDDHPARHGRLYFAVGNYIGEFDLRDGSSAAVVNLGDVVIDHLSSFNNGDLLITMRVYANGRETSRILRYNIRNSETLTMFPGMMAEYLGGTRAVVYDDGSNLLVTHRANAWRDEVLIDYHGFNARPSVAVISNSEILYSGIKDVDGENKVMMYRFDDANNSTTSLPELSSLCIVKDALWIPGRDRLMCKTRSLDGSLDDGASRYVLASTDGTSVSELSLPSEGLLRALVFLPDQDLVVFTQTLDTWGGGQPRNAVWIYDFANDTSYEIAKDQYLGNSVIYSP